jgi:methylenetetrahydrofolate dehydrogenase (NADP+)/methenyltetrahydrofolate cyclohydrolase
MLLQKNATVTICHSKTKNLEDITKRADILVAAIGSPGFVKEDMVKEGAIVIDVGINRVEKKLVGDVDFDKVSQKASQITPVPGGIGPMTIALLMKNSLTAFKNQMKIK